MRSWSNGSTLWCSSVRARAEAACGIWKKGAVEAEVEKQSAAVQDALQNKPRYPVEQFRAFWETGKRYVELTKNDLLIHRKVVVAIYGVTWFLRVERKRIADAILSYAQRLECLVFCG